MPLDSENKPSRKGRSVRPVTVRWPGGVDFSIEVHLLVQKTIENRAFVFWVRRGCPLGDELRDWLRAETEVIEEFCANYLAAGKMRDKSQPAKHIPIVWQQPPVEK